MSLVAPWLLNGALAALALGALDYLRLWLSDLESNLGWVEHAAHASTLIVGGTLAGFVLYASIHACSRLACRVARSLRGQIQMEAAMLATIALAAIIPVAVRLFEGRAIRETSAASWGPWTVAVLGWLGCYAVVTVGHRVIQIARGRPWRATVAGLACAALAAPWVYLDLYSYRGLYQYLHAVLMLVVYVLFLAALHIASIGLVGRSCSLNRVARSPQARKGVLATLLAALLCFLWTSPSYAHRLDEYPTHFSYVSRLIEVVRVATDFDRDGFSHLMGHRDNAVFDASIHPLAADIPDNGVDEDGVFGDLASTDLKRIRAASEQRDTAISRQVHGRRGSQSPLDLLLITVDALRFDRLAIPGSARTAMSILDEHLKEGIYFSLAFASSSFTQRSVSTIMTSRYDYMQAHQSLFDALAEGGCKTSLAFSHTPFHILDTSEPSVIRSIKAKRVINDVDAAAAGRFYSYMASEPTAGEIVDAALELVRGSLSDRTCMWVHLFDVHQWKTISPAKLGLSSTMAAHTERYDAFVRYT